jgi:hypothetical protein
MSPSRTPQKVDPRSHRREIDVGIVAAETTPRLMEFLSGLGLTHELTKTMTYWDYRVQINFHLTAPPTHRARIVWGPVDVGPSDATDLVMEIIELDHGIFNVNTRIRAKVPVKIAVLERVKLARSSLPLFVLAQMLTVMEAADSEKSDTVDEAAGQMELARERDFCNKFVPMACEKALLGGEIYG